MVVKYLGVAPIHWAVVAPVLPMLSWHNRLTPQHGGAPVTVGRVACLSVPHRWLGNSHMALGTRHQLSHSQGCGPSASLADVSESRLAGRRLSRPVGSGCVSLPPRHLAHREVSHSGSWLLVSWLVQEGWWFWSGVG